MILESEHTSDGSTDRLRENPAGFHFRHSVGAVTVEAGWTPLSRALVCGLLDDAGVEHSPP
jgi:hypothetical protein